MDDIMAAGAGRWTPDGHQGKCRLYGYIKENLALFIFHHRN